LAEFLIDALREHRHPTAPQTKNRHRPEGSSMNCTKIVAPAAVFVVLVLSALPARAQGRDFRGLGGIGISRGPVRAMAVPRGVVASPGPLVRRIAGAAPFNSSQYVFGPTVRVGYGLSVGYPVPFPYAYPSAHPYSAPFLAPAHGSRVVARSSLAIIGRVGAHVTRGAARLALRLLIP
jgi:hypothetical protein